MKKQTYKELRALICALVVASLASGCKTKTNDINSASNIEKSSETVTNDNSVSTEENSVSSDNKDNYSVEESKGSVSTKEATTVYEENSDKQVLEYMENLYNSISELEDSASIKARNGFISTIDFLFYDGEICGVTFDSLSASAKEKVIIISTKIVEKIDSKFPNLRSSVGEKYSEASLYLVNKKDELVDVVKGKLGRDNCDKISDYYKSAKDKASNTYDKAKEKVKNWYENYRDNE